MTIEKIYELLDNGYSIEQTEEITGSRYNTATAWLKSCNDTGYREKCDIDGNVVFTYNKSYVPIFCYLYKFARKQKTKESKAILYITETGKTIPTQEYYDYANAVYMRLYELCLRYTEKYNGVVCSVLFNPLLFIATKQAISETWNNDNGRTTETVIDSETGEKKRIEHTVSSVSEDIENHIERLTIDSYNGTETKAIRNYEMDVIFSNDRANLNRYMRLYAKGYTFDEIAMITGVRNGDSIRMALKRYGKELKRRKAI